MTEEGPGRISKPAACSQLRAGLYVYLTFSKQRTYRELLACPHIAQMGLGTQREAGVHRGPEEWGVQHTLSHTPPVLPVLPNL